MRVALSSTPIDNSSGKPKRRGCAAGRASAAASARPASSAGVNTKISPAAAMPINPIKTSEVRHGITTSKSAVSAGKIIFPRSPAKL